MGSVKTKFLDQRLGPISAVCVISITLLISGCSGKGSSAGGGGGGGSASTTTTTPKNAVVTGISPAKGFSGGGTLITITGTDFQSGATVTVGGVACTPVTVVSSTQITCTTGAATSDGSKDIVVTNSGAAASDPLTSHFTSQTAPTISSVTPSGGALAGGTQVRLDGFAFSPGGSVTLSGGQTCTPVVVSADQTYLTCTVVGSGSGPVDVGVVNPTENGVSGTSNPAQGVGAFTFQAAPIVSSISPTGGPLAGGGVVSIVGSNFLTAPTSVKLGGVACSAFSYVDSTHINCTVPAGSAGAVTAVVTNNDGQVSAAAGSYTYRAAPVVSSISLNGGPLAGGNVVSIIGSNFSAPSAVQIGGVDCSAFSLVDVNHINCTVPARSTGAVTAVVTNGDGQVSAAAGSYSYNAAPAVTSVSVASGRASGGLTIHIYGAGFLTSPSSVKLGGTSCASFTVNSGTDITCVTPSGTPGAVSAQVTNYDLQSGSGGTYTYVAAPVVSSISSNNGPLSGGNVVSIVGSNFLSAPTSVKLGGVACSAFSYVDSTHINCTVPAGSAGTVTAVVTNSDGQASSAGGSYTYNPLPVITSITETGGSGFGGNTIHINGTGFLASPSAVQLGGVGCTSFAYASPTSITCVTPGGAAGNVTASVTNSDGQSGSGGTYKYKSMLFIAQDSAAAFGSASEDSSTGALTGITLAAGSPAYAVAAHPTKAKIYSATSDGNVNSYTMGTDGSLTTSASAAPVDVVDKTSSLVVAPNGKFALITNSSWDEVTPIPIDGNGDLTTAGTPATAFYGSTQQSGPQGIVIDSTDHFAYAAFEGTSSVCAFTTDSATGALAQIGVTCAQAGDLTLGAPGNANTVAIDAGGKFLYAAGSGSTSVYSYTIGNTGSLSALSTTTVGAGNKILAANASYLFVAYGNQITSATINGTTGALGTFSSPVAITAAHHVTGIAVDPAGKYLFVGDKESKSIRTYSIGAGGALSVNDGGTGFTDSALLKTPLGLVFSAK